MSGVDGNDGVVSRRVISVLQINQRLYQFPERLKGEFVPCLQLS
jgi:hypothetical protein